MLSMKKKMFVLLCIFCITSIVFPVKKAYAEERSGSEAVIVELVNAIDQNDWDRFTELYNSDSQMMYEQYFADDTSTNGVKQVEQMRLVGLFDVESEMHSSMLLTKEYPILLEATEIDSYLLVCDCHVNKENEFFYEGINYFLIVLVEELGEMKVVQFNRPETEMVESVLTATPAMAESSENISVEDLLKGLNVLQMADYGIVVNGEGESVYNNSENEVIAPVASGTSDFPILEPGSWTNRQPQYITVKMNKTYPGESIRMDIPFDEYIKDTLPNEWIASWEMVSLKVGALCVKMVGWYRTVRPYDSTTGAHVSQYTQNYVPYTNHTRTDEAVDSQNALMMVNSDYKMFYPEYAAGTNCQAGNRASGQLKQRGSQYLASTQNYTVQEILDYYYKGSHFSDSNICFLGVR